ncbi:MAG: dTDP-4-dehydrorhamnose 3,5-epimerase [Candidatus Heimdallarchaeota archaeon LC_3]|nr:MAG: dTDP-4-dehydrorhamnose 3,5-epimerase [Candidatus Heimdallarchaeota archaeon LC_3]
MAKRFEKINTKFVDAFILRPKVYEDFRGYFKEVFRQNEFKELGIEAEFVQDNISHSVKHVLRGMHYDNNVDKLVQVVHGKTYHVIVDMRKISPTFKQWQSFILSDANHNMILVPKGFANGFLVLSDLAWVLYKQGTYYTDKGNTILKWNDPSIGIKWPIKNPSLSEQDA